MQILKRLWVFLYTEFILPVVARWKIWRADMAIKRAIRLADYKSSQHNGRKYIILRNSYGNYQSFCKQEFLIMRMKSHGVFDPSCTWGDILDDAVYITKK